MSLLDAYEEDIAQSFDKVPLAEPKKLEPKFSTWRTIKAAPRGLRAGAMEATGSTADMLGAFGSVLGATEAGGAGMFGGQSQKEKADAEKARKALLQDGPDYMSEGGRSFRNASKDYLPDPETAHMAENLVGNFTRLGGKVIAASAMMGAVPGAIIGGAEEGFTVADDLAVKGVDKETRTKVGAFTGALTSAGFALPVAGKTLAKSAAIVLAGGPLSFMAQQAGTAKILENANYAELSKQYDPTDPWGIALATGLPFTFAAGVHGVRAARAMPKSPSTKTGTQPPPLDSNKPLAQANTAQAAMKDVATVSQDAVDAAMTHNLTLLRDAQVLRGQDLPINPAVAQVNTAQAATKDVAPSVNYQAAFEKYGGKGNIDESLDISAKSNAFADVVQAEGWTVSERGAKYVTLQKDFGLDADGYSKTAIVKVRISDHSNVNRSAHFGEHDINIAPDDGYARDTFNTAIQKLRTAKVNDNLDTYFDTAKTANVITERGMQVQTRYKVVEADTLVTSHGNDLAANPAFPAELQPSGRARAASADQIARIENQIRPELLGESVKASDGAPIVGPDAVVESGNARTIALRRAYDSGKADEYRAWLLGNADRFGATAEAVAGMKRPVLVRERTGDIDRAEFTRQANESPVAALSPTEQARADAARTKDLGGLVPNEDGGVNMAQSAAWVRSFMQGVPPTERGAMMQADGQLSQAGAQRIRNAVFAKAYGDPAILSALSESTNSNIKNILSGLLRAAPDVAKLQDLIAAGARQPMDFAPDLVRAVRELSDLRARGVSVEQHLTQGSMFDGGLPAELNNLLVGLSENARSPKRVADMVKSMVQAVDNLGDPRQASLLSDAPPTRGDMTANAVERMRTLTDEQLTDTAPETFKPSTDPLMRSIADRVAVAEATHGDLPVGTTADGQPITIAQALEQVRREALDGTPDELGHNDAHLVQVAADCFLSTGV